MLIRRVGSSIHIDAPAKVNLFLEILGRRADGFHDIETLMVSVDLYDSLQFDGVDSPEITLTWASIAQGIPRTLPVDNRNLIVRAARLLQEHAGVSHGADIRVHKRIPIEAGLGGGSSDAAATLVGLNALWDLKLPVATLHELAAQLGSDINFFIESPRAAVCCGRGEQVTAVPFQGTLPMVLVKPSSGCSTKDIFQNLTLTNEVRSMASALRAVHCGNSVAVGQEFFNALQDAACVVNPDVAHLLSAIRNAGVVAAGMTGSGSTCVGICRSVRHAQRLVRQLRSQRLGQVFSVSAQI
ncbi:MAG: 4-(cytidine 5'-diphospho)-2-C-methyl-D-erythritol kinase [Planctomycetaceae bacterium]|nr:4-(cytidine 5'-diphospho)-2-C-methyl-D-erythritol kinase [Planctomycetaceae bacterium]